MTPKFSRFRLLLSAGLLLVCNQVYASPAAPTDFSSESYFGLSDYATASIHSVTHAALNQPMFSKLNRWSASADYNVITSKYSGGSDAAFDRNLTAQNGFFALSYGVAEDATLGIFAGYNRGRTSTSSTRFDYDGLLLGVTGNFRFNTRLPINLKAAFTNGDFNFDASRSLSGVAGAATLTNPKMKQSTFTLDAEVETRNRERSVVSATFGFTYDNLRTPGLTESGPSTALTIDPISQNTYTASVGVQVRYFKSAKTTYDVSAKVEKAFGTRSLSSKDLVSVGPTTKLDNPGGNEAILMVGAGMSYKPTQDGVFLAGIELRGGKDYSGDARLNLMFKGKF